MSYEVINNSPPDYSEIEIDKKSMREDLGEDEYYELFDNSSSELLDDDDEFLDKWELFDRYGLKYVNDDIWISVFDEENQSLKCGISSHDILSSLFYSPGQFEGLSAIVIDKFVGVFVSVAGGQGGGFALIDIEDNRWIFKTSEFSVQNILWVPAHEIFVCVHDVSTYAWHNISLVLIKVTGEMGWLDLYSHDHFNDSEAYDPSNLAILKKISTEDCVDEDEPLITYKPEDDSLHFHLNGYWVCDCKILLNIVDFK
jgi:hypothetical protein